MKLRELRELYEAPKSDLDDLADLDDHDRAEREPMHSIRGFDLGMGADSTRTTWRCDRCEAYVVLDPPSWKRFFIPICPKCDACAMCGQTYDENFDPLVMKTAVMRADPGELVRALKLCEVCMKSSEDKLREVLGF